METMVLLGAEDVNRAANSMREAAIEVMRAASYGDDVARQQRQFMDDWLMRFEGILDRFVIAAAPNARDGR